MVQRCFECSFADPVGAEEFCGVVHYDLFRILQFWQRLLVPESVHKCVADSLLPSPGGVGEPDVLAVFCSCGHDHQ